MLRFLSKGKLLDIGSGDGRLVVEAARMGFKSTGVELNRWLVYYSRWGKNICMIKNHLLLSTGFTRCLWQQWLDEPALRSIAQVDCLSLFR